MAADEFLSDAISSENVEEALGSEPTLPSAANTEAPFEIISPTKIKLGPEAKAWAQAHGMSLTQMARWLLSQDAQRQAGQIQMEGQN
jgi:hypothetical protein